MSMILKLYLKEWRENLMIFLLSILMMLTLAILSLTEQHTLTLYFSGMFLWLFLPFAGMLLGSGAFYSEFKDNAWVYLLSRPLRREFIWLTKYAAAFSILAVIYIIFSILLRYLPGLNAFILDLGMDSQFNGPVIAILAMTIAFSLSILYEKQFVLIFISILIGVGLALGLQKYLDFIFRAYFYYRDLKLLPLMLGLCFAGASILAFLKADFSQPGRKVKIYIQSLLLLILVTFAGTTVWVAKGRLFSSPSRFSIYPREIYAQGLYLTDIFGGIVRFSPAMNRFETLSHISDLSSGFSFADGKIAGFQIRSRDRWWQLDNLGIYPLEADSGTVVVNLRDPDSFYFKHIFNEECLLSPDGERLAFFTRGKSGAAYPRIYSLWVMNVDGSRTQRYDFSVEASQVFQLLAWAEEGKSIVLAHGSDVPSSSSLLRLEKIDLETDIRENLADKVLRNLQYPMISPIQNAMLFCTRDREGEGDTLYLLDLKTMEKKSLIRDNLLHLYKVRWNRACDRIAVSRADELWICDLSDYGFRRVYQWKGGFRQTRFDWACQDQKLVLMERASEGYQIMVMDENFAVEKILTPPIPISFFSQVWAWDHYVLVKTGRRGSFWSVELNTQTWHKIN